jgi:mRNA interferase MazF
MVLIVSVHDPSCPLAVATGLSLTRQFHQSRYEVALPKLPWMREYSFVNAQSLAAFKYVELQRMVGQLDATVVAEVQDAVGAWLGL